MNRFLFPLMFCWCCLAITCSKRDRVPEAPGQALSPQVNPWPPELYTLFQKGNYFIQQAPDSALFYFRRLEQRSRETGFEDGIGVALIHKGLLEINKGNNESGLLLYQRALPYCLKAKSLRAALPNLYINMGTYYSMQGKYYLASQYYYDALQYALKYIPDNINVASAYTNLSGIQCRLEQFQQALYYAEQGERFVRKHRYLSHFSAILNNKGDAYVGLNRLSEGYQALTEGLTYARQQKQLSQQQSLLSSLGDLMLRQGRNRESIPYFMEAMQVDTGVNTFYAIIMPGYSLGTAYYNLGEYDRAEEVLMKALALAATTGQKDKSIEAHATLASVYWATQNYKKAFEQQQWVLQLKDSLMNKEKVNAINEMEIKYETVRKDRDIAEKKLQISRQENRLTQKNIWISGVSLGAFLLGVLFISRNRINKQKQQSQDKQIYILQQEQELLKQEQEINYLKAVMHGEEKERVRIARDLHDGIVSQLMAVRLHFKAALRNAQHIIPNLPDFQHTLAYLDDATRELRKTAHNLMPETVLQGGLVVALHSFCKKMEGAASTKIYFQPYGSLSRMDPDIELSLYRMVQELVQNALKHAKASYILVQMDVEDNLLSITVEDNGIGCAEITRDHRDGMGLKNVATRVKALKGLMDIVSEQGTGTTVTMEFIINQEKTQEIV